MIATSSFERLKTGARKVPAASLALLTGAVAAYSHPGIAFAPLMPIALILLSFWAARARSFWGAATVGAAFGIGIFSVITIGARSWSWIVPVALTFLGAGLYALPIAILARIAVRARFGIEVFCATAGAWALCMELGDYLGFPTKGEGLAAIALTPYMMGGARLIGCNLVCGIMIAGMLGCGVRLAQGAVSCAKPDLVRSLWPLFGALTALTFTTGIAHLTAPAENGTLRVGIPQMNVPGEYFEHRLSFPDLSTAFEDVFDAQLRELSDVDLLVMSETFDGSYPLQVPKLRKRFENYARLQNQSVLLSSYLMARDGGIYNAVGAIDANGKLVGVHRKVNLAPFGEVEFEAGSHFSAISLSPGVRVGILICQESLLSNGPRALAEDAANVLVSPTSDVSFGSGLLSFEHLALAQMRAIETGRAVVWASAAGPSGMINRWGEFTAAGPFREAAAVKVTVELHDERTPYQEIRWFWQALAVGAALLASRSKRTMSVAVTSVARAGLLWRTMPFVFAAGGCAALSIFSAAAVELRSGSPARAIRSSLELARPRAAPLGVPTLDRFKTDVQHSADGALAFYLSFYGQAALPVTETAPTRSLAELSARLRQNEGFPTEVTSLHISALPRVASIVKSKTGEFGVITSDRAGRISLFRPAQADIQHLSSSEAEALLEPTLLYPGRDTELQTDLFE